MDALPTPASAAPTWRYGGILSILGVWLPAVTLAFELTTGGCARVLFDPIPSPGHVVLVAFVIVANALVARAGWMGPVTRPRLLGFASGAALSISGFYAICFLPASPVSVMAIVMLIGILALAPIMAFVAAILLRVRWVKRNRRLGAPPPGGLALGILVGLAALVLADLPRILLEPRLERAASDDPAVRNPALAELRASLWDTSILGRMRRGDNVLNPLSAVLAIQREGRLEAFLEPSGWLESRVSDASLAEIIYRATGRLPDRWNDRFWWDDPDDDALPTLPERNVPVSLAGSRISGSIEPDEGWALLDWSLTLKNRGEFQAEAVLGVALPPGAVIADAALWIAGKPRRATYASREKTTEAYERVVNRNRDPLLVVSDGVDRVRLRCFPVPPGGEPMRFRLRIAAPIRPQDQTNGRLALPVIDETNFMLSDAYRHEIALTTSRPATALPEGFTVADDGAIQARLENERLPDASLTLPLPAMGTQVLGLDPTSRGTALLVRTLEEEGTPRPALVLVVDGSGRMEEHAEAMAEFVSELPGDIELAAVIAGDVVVSLTDGVAPAGRDDLTRIAARIREYPYAGGADQLPALVEARRLAGARPGARLLWIRSPQAVVLSPIRPMLDAWWDTPGAPITGLEVIPGHCVISETLRQGFEFVEARATGSVEGRLARVREAWFPQRSRPAWRTTGGQSSIVFAGVESAPVLAALWARDEVESRLHAGGGREEALRLSRHYRIVTPVSGAVILETKEQYEQAGLEPYTVAGGAPEPQTVLLFGLGIAILAGVAWRRRRSTLGRA